MLHPVGIVFLLSCDSHQKPFWMWHTARAYAPSFDEGNTPHILLVLKRKGYSLLWALSRRAIACFTPQRLVAKRELPKLLPVISWLLWSGWSSSFILLKVMAICLFVSTGRTIGLGLCLNWNTRSCTQTHWCDKKLPSNSSRTSYISSIKPYRQTSTSTSLAIRCSNLGLFHGTF